MSSTDAGDAGAPNPTDAPQIQILAQYVKDLSFENPNALQLLRGQRPELAVNVDVQARGVGPEQFEVELRFTVAGKQGTADSFVVELSYAGVFAFRNVPQEALQPVTLIECPRLLFPFARRVIADITRDGGLPPLMLDPIDFAGLYRQQLTEAQRAGAAGSA